MATICNYYHYPNRRRLRNSASMLVLVVLAVLFASFNSTLLFAAACDDLIYVDGFETTPTVCNPSPVLTYKLSESTTATNLWTTPVAAKVQTNATAPSAQQSGLLLHAAKHEFEPVQAGAKECTDRM